MKNKKLKKYVVIDYLGNECGEFYFKLTAYIFKRKHFYYTIVKRW